MTSTIIQCVEGFAPETNANASETEPCERITHSIKTADENEKRNVFNSSVPGDLNLYNGFNLVPVLGSSCLSPAMQDSGTPKD